jgi:GTPase SAR1 family protein
MIISEMTDRLELALRFVNSTNSHIFLTGKAGTGKTTFLRQLASSTHKRHVILAPTGIAALNAGGTTIHSQFLLPFGTFIPDRNASFNDNYQTGYYTQTSLARKHPLNSIRKQVLRNIDLLIIDEVSMLRADLLDAIDYRMRAVKGNYNVSFGGVQVLMIGDLYQLPPIIKDQERPLMERYYKSAHFFEAVALKQDGFILVELDKIFRQHDDRFISLLNNLRNNIATRQDTETLNQYFLPPAQHPTEEIITITTHNSIADSLNRKALNNLPGPSRYYQAEVEGEFPEHIFPVSESLELRAGAQVMFIKNDSLEKVYFNGKLARVETIDEDEVVVRMSDTNELFTLRQEEWQNKRYTVNASTKEMEEEVIGRFRQYPIKLAWAITVHKSQGLTFEKAIIDVGQAFAPGQVYVALSRLTSLDGLILRTKIDPDVVSTDRDVMAFTNAKASQPDLSFLLQQKQREYLLVILANTFDLGGLVSQIDYVLSKHNVTEEFEDERMRTALIQLKTKFLSEKENTARFAIQLKSLLNKEEVVQLQERVQKGSDYYRQFVWMCLKDLLIHIAHVHQFSKTKTYASALAEIDLLLMKKFEEIQKAPHVTQSILAGEDIKRNENNERERAKARINLESEVAAFAADNPAKAGGKSGRKKRVVGETYTISYNMFHEGKSPKEIATERKLATSTIEGHIAKGVAAGEIDIKKVMDDETRLAIIEFLKESNTFSHNELREKNNGKFSEYHLKVVLACIRPSSK